MVLVVVVGVSGGDGSNLTGFVALTLTRCCGVQGGNGLDSSKGAEGVFGNGGVFYLFQVTCPDGSKQMFSKPFKQTHGNPAPAVGYPPLASFAVPADLWRLAEGQVKGFKWNANMMLNKIDDLAGFKVEPVRRLKDNEEHKLYRKMRPVA